MSLDSEKRFWSRVERAGASECWIWQGARDTGGYGNASFNGDHWKAHRLAFRLANGKILPGMVIMHSCDNPPCCNPSHLRMGTQKENSLDAVRRGRMSRGQDHM